MEKCGCRSVTGYPDGGSFSLTNVNLIMPLRIDSNARDGMAFFTLAKDAAHRRGQAHVADRHLCWVRNSGENDAVVSRIRDPYSTEASSSLPSCHSFHEVIKT
jgi:hypothetical protein